MMMTMITCLKTKAAIIQAPRPNSGTPVAIAAPNAAPPDATPPRAEDARHKIAATATIAAPTRAQTARFHRKRAGQKPRKSYR